MYRRGQRGMALVEVTENEADNYIGRDGDGKSVVATPDERSRNIMKKVYWARMRQ